MPNPKSARVKAHREKLKQTWSAETKGRHRAEIEWAPGEREALIARALEDGKVTRCEMTGFAPTVFAGQRRRTGVAQILEPIVNRYQE